MPDGKKGPEEQEDDSSAGDVVGAHLKPCGLAEPPARSAHAPGPSDVRPPHPPPLPVSSRAPSSRGTSRDLLGLQTSEEKHVARGGTAER